MRAPWRHRGIDHGGRIAEQRNQSSGQWLERSNDGVDAGHFAAERLDHGRPLLEREGSLLRKPVQVPEIARADAGAPHLVLVGRSDPLLGRPDVLPHLPELVHEDVIRKDHVRAVAHHEPLFDPGAAASRELVDLSQQHGQVDDDALGQNALRAIAQNSARQEPNDDLFVADHERVACVGTTGEPDDHVRELGVDVDDLSFAFIAPLGADDCYD